MSGLAAQLMRLHGSQGYLERDPATLLGNTGPPSGEPRAWFQAAQRRRSVEAVNSSGAASSRRLGQVTPPARNGYSRRNASCCRLHAGDDFQMGFWAIAMIAWAISMSPCGRGCP